MNLESKVTISNPNLQSHINVRQKKNTEIKIFDGHDY